jgi:hypothetical protein
MGRTKQLEVGERVRYSSEWCRNTGQIMGDVPFARGIVCSIEPLVILDHEGDHVVTVNWLGTLETEDGSGMSRALSCNLERCR